MPVSASGADSEGDATGNFELELAANEPTAGCCPNTVTQTDSKLVNVMECRLWIR